MTASTRSFVGDRLRLARIFFGLSQVEVADRVGVSQAYVHQLEAGSRQQPTPTLVLALAATLHIPPAFLCQPASSEFREEECAFRRRASTPLSQRLRVLAHGTLFAELVQVLEQYVDFPTPNVPHIRVSCRNDIELAAEATRRQWGIPLDAPIANVVRVLENAGIIVTRFGASAEKIDAFSRAGERDFIVLNTDKGSTSRTRYDCGHECGHLVMHRGLELGTPEREEEANAFAASLLLPRAAFIREFGYQPRPALEHLIQLKVRWRVSIAAIVRRAFDVQLISAAEYRRLNIELRQHMFTSEPGEPPEEIPEVVRIALETLAEARGLTSRRLAADLGWSKELFERVTGASTTETAVGGTRDVIPIEHARRRRGR